MRRAWVAGQGLSAALLAMCAFLAAPMALAQPYPVDAPAPATPAPATPVDRSREHAGGFEAMVGRDARLLGAAVARVSRDDVRVTWQRGCPVHWRDLRAVRMSFLTLDGSERRGTLVVHRSVVRDVVAAFAAGYRSGFVMERMRPAEVYRGNDDASMAANNTSAFNCRTTADGTARYSRHAWGDAVDINPVQNPFLYRGTTYPAAGVEFINRDVEHPGLMDSDSAIVRSFIERGWRWGGAWPAPDYQHLSKIRPDEPNSL